MAQRVSRGPLQIAEVDIHLINEVFRQIQLEIDNIRGLSGGNVQIGEHTHAATTDSDSPPFGGAISHDDLDDVSVNDHHNKSHAHDGGDGSGTVSFDDLTDVPLSFEQLDEAQLTEKPFDSIIAGTNITITELANGDAIEIAAASGGVTDHGALTGLSDDDHSDVYPLITNFEADRATIATNWDDLTDGGETALHSHAGTTSFTDTALSEAQLTEKPFDRLIAGDNITLTELADGDALSIAATATSLTVEEKDTLSVANVDTIIFNRNDFDVTDNGGGTVTVDLDGTPASSANTDQALEDARIYIEPLDIPGVGEGHIFVTIDGGGSAITTGVKGDLYLPFPITLKWAAILADQSSSSIVIDVWHVAGLGAIPTDSNSITASDPPTLTNGVDSIDTNIATWTVDLNPGRMRFNVDSITTTTRAQLILGYQRRDVL